MTEKEQMMEAELQIIEDMKGLLLRQPEEGLHWKGSTQDLVYMTHILYESEEVWENDMLVPFIVLLRRVCAIVHCRVPKNPHSYLSNALKCSGFRKKPLLLRYHGLEV